MRIYYWPEMDQLVIIHSFYNNIFAGDIELSAGKNGWYKSQFPIDVIINLLRNGELIYEV